MRKVIMYAGIYLSVSIFLGLLGLAACYPDYPSSPAGWARLFLLPLPLTIAVNLAGHWLWNNRLAQRVDYHTREKPLSLLRIAYGVVMLSGAVLLMLAAPYAWQRFACGP